MMTALKRITSYLRRHKAEFRLAARSTIAAGLCFCLALALGFPHGIWMVITALVVMQATLGSSLKAATDRMMGTLAGALWGGVLAMVVTPESQLAEFAALIAAVAPMALLAALRASFRIAPITAVIVMLPQAQGALPAWLFPLERVLEITLGIGVGVGVARYVLPAQAHHTLLDMAAKLAELNSELIDTLIGNLLTGEGRANVPTLHARIRNTLRKADVALEESMRERRSHFVPSRNGEPLLRTLYRVRHDLVMIGRACSAILPEPAKAALEGSLKGLRDAVMHTNTRLASALKQGHTVEPSDEFSGELANYVVAMDELRQSDALQDLPGDAFGRIYALRFAFEQLGQDLRDLVRHVDEIVEH